MNYPIPIKNIAIATLLASVSIPSAQATLPSLPQAGTSLSPEKRQPETLANILYSLDKCYVSDQGNSYDVRLSVNFNIQSNKPRNQIGMPLINLGNRMPLLAEEFDRSFIKAIHDAYETTPTLKPETQRLIFSHSFRTAVRENMLPIIEQDGVFQSSAQINGSVQKGCQERKDAVAPTQKPASAQPLI